jgi:hypothetical protein
MPDPNDSNDPISTAAISAPAGADGASRERTLTIRLAPANQSDQPVVANYSAINLAPGMAFIDFGFIEPATLASLPRAAQPGGKMPESLNGRLAVRVALGYDGLSQLQQQLTRVLNELAKAAKGRDRP